MEVRAEVDMPDLLKVASCSNSDKLAAITSIDSARKSSARPLATADSTNWLIDLLLQSGSTEAEVQGISCHSKARR